MTVQTVKPGLTAEERSIKVCKPHRYLVVSICGQFSAYFADDLMQLGLFGEPQVGEKL
jgi:hypothetical protein